jgi:hypothetical protein
MYNKIFTKILDSSIWLEPIATRVVWLTFIAAMDENGFAQFASPANLAHRAIVPLEDTIKALATLEGPDPNSSDKDHDGRRLERVPGGWMVLNSKKYRDMVTRAHCQEKTKERVRAFREKKRTCNAGVTQGNETVTPSEAEAEAEAEAETKNKNTGRVKAAPVSFTRPTVKEVEAYCQERGNSVDAQAFMDHYDSNGWKVGKNPMKSWQAAVRTWERSDLSKKKQEVCPYPNGSSQWIDWCGQRGLVQL